MEPVRELRYRCVVFDVDGTLLDTREPMLSALDEMLRGLGRAPVGAAVLTQAMHKGLSAMLRAALEQTGTVPEESQLQALSLALRRRYLASAASTVRLYTDVVPLLRMLCSHGAWTAVCSNQDQHSVETLLDLFDLRRYFRDVVGGDTFVAHKPDPMGLQWLMLRAHSAPHTTLMVGDSALDAECARRAGADAVLMAHGYGSQDVPGRHTMAADFAELRARLLTDTLFP